MSFLLKPSSGPVDSGGHGVYSSIAMRIRWLRLAASGLALGWILAGSPAANGQSDELLKIDSSIKPKRLARGEEGKVVLTLKIPDGTFLSAQPSFIIEFLPAPEIVFPKNFFTASDLGIAVIEAGKESYLDLSKPIEIPFTVSPDAIRGGHILEGRIKYFARSPEEEWCYKTTSKFSTAFATSPAIARKKQVPPPPEASGSKPGNG
ncbi:MAG: hypothetical protein ACYDH0_02835 [Candidatus Aminicenantales bacterium]